MATMSNSFRTASAVITGTNHVLAGTPCQDSVAKYCNSKCCTIALSDGAGSRLYSNIGSSVASKSAAKYVTEHFNELYDKSAEEVKDEILINVRTSLYEVAVERNIEMRNFGCTLLIVGMDSETKKVLIFHVGDGLIFGCDCFGNTSLISSYDHQVADNVTELITSKELKSCFLYRSKGEYIGFMLLSDGPELLLKNNKQLAQAVMTISFLLPFKKLDEEYNSLFCGLTDDASVITLVSNDKIANVFKSGSKKMLSAVLGISENIIKKRKDTYTQFLTAVSQRNVTVNEAVRILHQHNKNRMKDKLQPLINSELVIYQNGKYILNKEYQSE